MKPIFAVVAAIIAILALFYFIESPSPEPGLTEAERQHIAQEVLNAASAIRNDAETMDYEAAQASWITDVSAYFVGEPAVYLNRMVLLADPAAVEEYWAPSQETRSGTRLMPTQEYVAVLSRDAALHVYRGDWEVLGLEGNVASHGPIAATTLFVREEDGWKQLHYHQSWDAVTEEEGEEG